jgi:hypothetical protein
VVPGYPHGHHDRRVTSHPNYAGVDLKGEARRTHHQESPQLSQLR